MKRTSIAARLARQLILAMGTLWLLCVAGASWYVHREVNRNFDAELVESAHRMIDIVSHELEEYGYHRDGIERTRIAPPPLIASDPVVFQLVDHQGRVLIRSAQAPPQAFAPDLAPGFADTDTWRIYTVAHPSLPLRLHMADPLAERTLALTRTVLGLALPMAATLPLIGWLLWRIARRELAPLNRIAAQIATRSRSDLSPLPTDGLPLELASVAHDVNQLLVRLHDALDVERALAANAAHELRTPLAAARLRLEAALEGDIGPDDVRAAIDALARLGQRTERLLQLSRAESGAVLDRRPVDLIRLAAAVSEEFWDQPANRDRLHLQVPDSELPPVPGDFDGLAIALRNLVDNALRHSQGAPVTLAVESPAALVVRDGGPGVAAQDLARLAERHVRRSSDSPGYGLGLSIVHTLVERHGARLTLRSPPAGQDSGFEARIDWPHTPEPV